MNISKFAGLLLSLIAAGPALADPPIGSRLGDRTAGSSIKSEVVAARKAHDFANCLVHLRAPSAKAFLAATTMDAELQARSSLSREIECNTNSADNDFVEGHRLMFPDDLLRGMLAEVFVTDHRTEVAALSALPRQAMYSRAWFGATGRDRVVDEMAACVADVEPHGADRLVTSRPYSPEESSAFQSLVPIMGPCLTVGATLRAGHQALRAALADALYQRMFGTEATAPIAPAGSH